MRYDPTLLAFEEDIRRRTFADWLMAHTSFMKPLHRYVGVLTVESASMVFDGRDRKVGGRFGLVVPLDDVRDVRLGFDDLFRRGEDRQLGLFGFAPLRITYRTETVQPTAYLFAAFRNGFLGRGSENERLRDELLAGGAGRLR